MLVNAGLDINLQSTQDRLHNTALHDAVQMGSIRAANQLIQLKCDVNMQNDLGLTPIAIATLKGDESMVNILLKCEDINVNISDNNGKTCYNHAKENGFHQLMSLFPETEWNLSNDPQWQSLIEQTIQEQQQANEKKSKGKKGDKKGKGKKKK